MANIVKKLKDIRKYLDSVPNKTGNEHRKVMEKKIIPDVIAAIGESIENQRVKDIANNVVILHFLRTGKMIYKDQLTLSSIENEMVSIKYTLQSFMVESTIILKQEKPSDVLKLTIDISQIVEILISMHK